ncbi:hypothetical protein JCM6882_005207 [Rhodosporidiobolus microsporus]
MEPRVPLELQQKILQQAIPPIKAWSSRDRRPAQKERLRDLKSFSLVHPGWRAIAQRELFAYLSFTSSARFSDVHWVMVRLEELRDRRRQRKPLAPLTVEVHVPSPLGEMSGAGHKEINWAREVLRKDRECLGELRVRFSGEGSHFMRDFCHALAFYRKLALISSAPMGEHATIAEVPTCVGRTHLYLERVVPEPGNCGPTSGLVDLRLRSIDLDGTDIPEDFLAEFPYLTSLGLSCTHGDSFNTFLSHTSSSLEHLLVHLDGTHDPEPYLAAVQGLSSPPKTLTIVLSPDVYVDKEAQKELVKWFKENNVEGKVKRVEPADFDLEAWEP